MTDTSFIQAVWDQAVPETLKCWTVHNSESHTIMYILMGKAIDMASLCPHYEKGVVIFPLRLAQRVHAQYQEYMTPRVCSLGPFLLWVSVTAEFRDYITFGVQI